MRMRRRTLLLGLAVLLLLAVGIEAAVLWLTPTGTLAEKAAAKVYAVAPPSRASCDRRSWPKLSCEIDR